MPFFNVIPQFFENWSKRKFDQKQTEALLDVITYVMVADGVTSTEERAQIEKALDGVKWEGSDSAADYVARAEQRLRAADGNQDFLQNAAAVITDQELREEVYYLAARMAGADKQLVAEETAFLHALTAAFGIGGERLRLLTARLMDEGHV